MFIGNHPILDYFKQAAVQGTLNQAYGFIGISQIGKRTLAEIIAAELLRQDRSKLNLHPDFHMIRRLVDEKTGKTKKDIAVGQARELKSRLQSRPWLAGYRVVIIDEVECFNDESANSLLKLLEEPGIKNIFFLLSEDESKILPTIRSRCQWWYFNPVSAAEIKEGLTVAGVEVESAERVAIWSWGRPGRALELSADNQKLTLIADEARRYQKLRLAPVYERFKIIESLAGEKKVAANGKDELDEILQIWTMVERQEMLRVSAMFQKNSVKVIDGLTRLRAYLGQNIHPRLALEELMLNF